MPINCSLWYWTTGLTNKTRDIKTPFAFHLIKPGLKKDVRIRCSLYPLDQSVVIYMSLYSTANSVVRNTSKMKRAKFVRAKFVSFSEVFNTRQYLIEWNFIHKCLETNNFGLDIRQWIEVFHKLVVFWITDTPQKKIAHFPAHCSLSYCYWVTRPKL